MKERPTRALERTDTAQKARGPAPLTAINVGRQVRIAAAEMAGNEMHRLDWEWLEKAD